eukprot:364737_1
MELNSAYLVHNTMCGMYFTHVFLTDWCMALWETNKSVFCWLMVMMTTFMTGILLGIIYSDFSGFGVPICLHIAVMAMVYVSTPYNGMTKKMGLSHGIAITIPVIYAIIRLCTDLGCNSSVFCEQITFDNKPGLFIYLIVHNIVFGLSITLDFVDAYIWYIKGDHTVIRSLKTLNELKKRGLLSDDIGQIQVIQTGHNRTDNINQFGYLIVDSDLETSMNV